MSYNKTVNDFQFRWIQGLINPWNMIFTSDVSVNIMFHRLINPCIHLIESHQLYNIFVHYSVSEIATLILSMSLNFIKAWMNDKWYNKRVLIWHFNLVLIKINYGQIGDQTGLFYTTNPVFYTSGNRFVHRTGTFGNLWFSHLSRRTTVIHDLLVRRQFSLVSDKR
jgi:hypothetical protein